MFNANYLPHSHIVHQASGLYSDEFSLRAFAQLKICPLDVDKLDPILNYFVEVTNGGCKLQTAEAYCKIEIKAGMPVLGRNL